MMNNLREETTKYKQEMDDWIKSLSLPIYNPGTDEIENILGLTRQDMRLQSSVELSENAVILSQYALFLQQKVNECNTFLKWADKIQQILSCDDRSKLNQWIKKASLRLERIQYLARRIEVICQSINGLVRARYNEGTNI